MPFNILTPAQRRIATYLSLALAEDESDILVHPDAKAHRSKEAIQVSIKKVTQRITKLAATVKDKSVPKSKRDKAAESLKHAKAHKVDLEKQLKSVKPASSSAPGSAQGSTPSPAAHTMPTGPTDKSSTSPEPTKATGTETESKEPEASKDGPPVVKHEKELLNTGLDSSHDTGPSLITKPIHSEPSDSAPSKLAEIEKLHPLLTAPPKPGSVLGTDMGAIMAKEPKEKITIGDYDLDVPQPIAKHFNKCKDDPKFMPVLNNIVDAFKDLKSKGVKHLIDGKPNPVVIDTFMKAIAKPVRPVTPEPKDEPEPKDRGESRYSEPKEKNFFGKIIDEFADKVKSFPEQAIRTFTDPLLDAMNRDTFIMLLALGMMLM